MEIQILDNLAEDGKSLDGNTEFNARIALTK